MLKDKLLKKLLGLMIVVLGLAYVQAFGQSAANLNGNVTDEKDDAVPGATVRVINDAAGLERTVTTNENGSFAVPLLPPNTYRVLVERAGFAPFEASNVVLNTNDQRSLTIRLKVGEVGATVQVEADAQTVNQNPATSTVVDQTFVQNIPLNGRTIQSLLTLTPGIVVGGGDGQLSVNGQRTNANYLTIDGVSGNISVGRTGGTAPLSSATSTTTASTDQNASGANPGFNLLGGTNNLFSIEELQEVNLQTSNTTAAFGRQAGGQIATTTRSGSNDFHGSIYDYWRHEQFAARDFFTNASTTFVPTQRLRQHNFGVFVSGPVILPGFGEGTPLLWKGKDKTFFYFNYEGLRLTQPQAARVFLVPSTQLRNLATLNPTVRAILNAYPLPTDDTATGCRIRILNGSNSNRTTAALPTGTPLATCFLNATSNQTKMDAFRFKIDQRVNDKNSLSFRFNRSPMSVLSTVGSLLTETLQTTTTVTGNYRTVFTSKLINEFNINWSKNATSSINDLTTNGGAVPFSASLLLPSNAPEKSAVLFANPSLGLPILNIGPTRENIQNQWNVTDNFRWIVKNHSFGFGIDYRRLSPLIGPVSYQVTLQGTNVSSLTNAVPTISSLSTFNNDTVKLRYDNFSAYAQDTWQASKDLTLDFGVRWEVNTPPKGVNIPLYTIKGFPDTNNLSLSTDPLFETIYTAFAPRFGAAYQLNRKQGWETTLRGGVGLYYDLGQGTLSSGAAQFPYFRRLPAPRTNVPFPLTDANLAPPAAANLNGPYTGQGFTLVAPGYVLPRTYQWSFSLDQAVGRNNVITASYVANAGRKLLRRYFSLFAPAVPSAANTLPVNPLFPDASLNITRNDGDYGDYSDYKSLQIQYVRRLTNGLQVLANYTLGKAQDTGSSDSIGSISFANIGNTNAYLPKNFYGYSDFDRRHIFNTAVTYQLPSWKFDNQAMQLLNNILVKGWATDFNYKFQSAAPFNVTYNYIDNVSGRNFVFLADVVSGQDPFISDLTAPGGRRLNPAAFSVPVTALTTDPSKPGNGNQVKNSLRGFNLAQLDFSLRRTFSLTEKLRLQFRGEAFNVLNRPNFSPPASDLGNVSGTNGVFTPFTTFGRSTTTITNASSNANVNGGLSSIYAIGGPRTIQFSMRIEF